ETWSFYWQLSKSQTVKTFLTAITLGTAFTVAMLWSFGAEVLPLVDKGQLLILIAFYCGTLTVVLRLAASFVESGWAGSTACARIASFLAIFARLATRNLRSHRFTSKRISRILHKSVIVAERPQKRWLVLACYLLF